MNRKGAIWIGLSALLALSLVFLIRSWSRSDELPPLKKAPEPASVAALLPAAQGAVTPSAPAPDPRQQPVDSKEIDLRYNASGKESFARLSRNKQEDELRETLRDEAKALDRAVGDHLRGKAFERLLERGAVSKTVAVSMADLIQNSTQAEVRIALSDAVKGRLDHPELVDALLGRLLSDPHEMVRKRAAQSLADRRLEDPRIQTALQRLQTEDPSPFVQDAIRRILERQPGPRKSP